MNAIKNKLKLNINNCNFLGNKLDTTKIPSDTLSENNRIRTT